MTKRTYLGDITEQQRRITEMQDYLNEGVFQARVVGHTWDEIGQALGISKQTAFNRYSPYCLKREGSTAGGETGEE